MMEHHVEPSENTPVRHMVSSKFAVVCNFNNSSLAKAIVASNSIALQHARQLRSRRKKSI
jgi:hypothetical protein